MTGSIAQSTEAALTMRASIAPTWFIAAALVVSSWAASAIAQGSSSTFQPPNLRIINPIPEPPPEASGRTVAPPFACPEGYQVPRGAAVKACVPVDMTLGNCGGRAGVYACGRNATECCGATEDNPCFAGAYACSLDASGPRHACCLK